MTKDEIGRILNPIFPSIYVPTSAPTKLVFKDETEKVGYFEYTAESDNLEKENKYTFIEYRNAIDYRATGDFDFVTIVNIEEVDAVEYPSFSKVLFEKLSRLKESTQQKVVQDWNKYKEVWQNDIKELHGQIVYSWLREYDENKLIDFAFIPTKRNDPQLEEYLTSILEMTLINGKTLVLEPVSAVTSEYNGRLDLYVRGNALKRVPIMRQLAEEKAIWIIARSYDHSDHTTFNKSQIERLISEWVL